MFEEVFGVKYYCGSDIKVKGLGIFEGTTLTDFKLLVAKTFSLNHETVALHYQLPLRGYHYAAIEDDKDVEKIFQTCEVAVRVCVFGTPVDMKTR